MVARLEADVGGGALGAIPGGAQRKNFGVRLACLGVVSHANYLHKNIQTITLNSIPNTWKIMFSLSTEIPTRFGANS